jgi:hypothetical protein
MKKCKGCKNYKESEDFYDRAILCKECQKDRADKLAKKITCFIYIVTNPAWINYVKIGRTYDIKRRLEIYQTHSPLRDYEAYYLKKVSNIRDLERYFKSNFKSTGNGEWVEIDKDEAVKIIETLGKLEN